MTAESQDSQKALPQDFKDMHAAPLIIGVPRESRPSETRVGATPDSVKKLLKAGFRFRIERDAGALAGFPDREFQMEGVELVDSAGALGCDLIFKVNRPNEAEIGRMKRGALLFTFMELFLQDGIMEKLAAAGVDTIAMELIPRTSRAQSMDALSSQANIAGYRAVIEAAVHYGRFFPMMMTAAGSSKPARLVVLGAGVAGLQAIGTARRLGAQVEAYDVRAEVKEQILSLGAKFIDLDIGEEGSGAGGYARELSEEAKRRQQQLLTERLKKADIIVSTANVPGRKAPTLITEDAVRGMRPGSVIVDMAAPSGGNCPLTEAERVVVKHDVKIVGLTNYPALVPSDSSSFYSRNILNLVSLLVTQKEGKPLYRLPIEDDIIAASLVTYQGQVRWSRK